MQRRWYPHILLVGFLVLWGVLSFTTRDPTVWALEHVLTALILLLLVVSFKKFRLTDLSYTLITIFLVLHTIGAYYTYAQVPFGQWLVHVFDLSRNPYDRIVHFSFGLLLTYPLRELFLRIGSARGVWTYWLPIELTLAASALYELLEWIVGIAAGAAGQKFVATQGDPYDAQKDMLNAFIGSCVTTIVIAYKQYRRNPLLFKHQLRRSTRARKRLPPSEE